MKLAFGGPIATDVCVSAARDHGIQSRNQGALACEFGGWVAAGSPSRSFQLSLRQRTANKLPCGFNTP